MNEFMLITDEQLLRLVLLVVLIQAVCWVVFNVFVWLIDWFFEARNLRKGLEHVLENSKPKPETKASIRRDGEALPYNLEPQSTGTDNVGVIIPTWPDTLGRIPQSGSGTYGPDGKIKQ